MRQVQVFDRGEWMPREFARLLPGDVFRMADSRGLDPDIKETWCADSRPFPAPPGKAEWAPRDETVLMVYCHAVCMITS